MDAVTPAGPAVGRNCADCEFYDLRKHPGAGFLASRKPFCVALGFFLFGNHATDCKLYRPRPGITTKDMGR